MDTLSAVDVSGHTEKKGKFTYLSWTWAWGLVKGLYPTATFEKKTFRDNQNNILPFMRDHKRYTYVACSVTIEGIVQEEIYPVTDNRNEPVLDANSYQVNTALQRCLVKCLAYHGLGTQVYAEKTYQSLQKTTELLMSKQLPNYLIQYAKTFTSVLQLMTSNLSGKLTLQRLPS